MGKYLVKRLIHGAVSVVVVVALIMIMVYALLNRDLVFAKDTTYTHQSNNSKVTYTYSKWEEYGYLDYVPFTDYLTELVRSGEMDAETRDSVSLGRTPSADSDLTAQYVEQFVRYYESQGYTVTRLDAVTMAGKKLADGGQPQLFAYRDVPLMNRLWDYFTGLFTIDNVHYVQEEIEDRGLTFTLHDPAYGGEKFSPAIMGNGTYHKYLLYCDSRFPYVHQNMFSLNLGVSYSINQGIDVFTTMTRPQGSYVRSIVNYPTGLAESSADDLHTATYVAGTLSMSQLNMDRFTDDYTNVDTVKAGLSKMGYSFTIGIVSVIVAYLLGVPLGIMMARQKEKFLDKLGTVYIVFIIAVPSLAYIFIFKAIGGKMGLPTTFDMEASKNWLMYVLPMVSLALPSIANLMKWMRRYMIDQANADYVKFARSGGLSEGEIFTKHIMKNAAIPIVHGIPGSVLFAMTGAIITERVYVVPGAGNLLTQAINAYDNGVIVGVAMFYAVLSVVSIILGDILMATVDPRISFTSKAR